MKKLLRDKKTGAFFNDGVWTADWRDAQRFEITEAQHTIRQHQLHGVELYYLYGDTPSEEFDWTIQLGPA